MVTARLHPRPAGLPEAVKWCGWCGTATHKSYLHKCDGSQPHTHSAKLAPPDHPGLAKVRRPKRGGDTAALLAAQLAAAGYWETTERENDGMRWQDCFRRQHPWGLALVPERGFTADVAFLGARLLCEVTGMAHAAGRSKVRADVEREGLAVSLGWTVLPLTPEQVRDGSAVALIARALNQSARAEGG